MDINKVETQAIVAASNQCAVEAVKELNELQLCLVGGGIEVSFN